MKKQAQVDFDGDLKALRFRKYDHELTFFWASSAMIEVKYRQIYTKLTTTKTINEKNIGTVINWIYNTDPLTLEGFEEFINGINFTESLPI